MTKTHSNTCRPIRIALLLLLVYIAFAPVLSSGFVDWDDREMIVRNPMLTPGHAADVMRSWARPTLDLYAPLTYTAYAGIAAIGRALFGTLQPVLFHAANLAVHAMSAVMVIILLRRLGGDDRSSLLGALVWAVHPIQAEAVAWAASLNTCLCAMFAITALLLQTMALDTPTRGRRTLLFIAAAVALVLSLCAKPASVGLPLAAMGINRFMLRRSWRISIGISTAGAMLTIPFILLGASAQPGTGGFMLSIAERMAVVGHTFAFYLFKIVAPVGFTIDYGLSPDTVLASDWLPWCGLAVLPIAATLVWQLRRRPWLAGAACVFAAGIGPVSGLRNFEFQNISTVADRYAYFAMLGVAIVVALALRGRLRSRQHCVIAATIIVVLAAQTFATTLKWHDSAALDRATIAANPQSLAAVILEADRAFDANDLLGAERACRFFLHRRPTFLPLNKTMGYLLLGTNRPAEAVYYFRPALAIMPDADVYDALGVAFIRSGQYPAALQAIDAAITLRPTDATEYANKGELLHRMQNDPAAIEAFRTALRIDPVNVAALGGLQKITP